MKNFIVLFFVSAFVLTSFTADNNFNDNPSDLITSEVTVATQLDYNNVLSPEDMVIVQGIRECRNACFQSFLHHGSLTALLDCFDACTDTEM